MRSTLANLVLVPAISVVCVACGGSESSDPQPSGGGGSGTAGTNAAGTGTAGTGTAGAGGSGTAGTGTAGMVGTGESKLPSFAVNKLYQGSGKDDMEWAAVAMNVDGLAFPTADLNTHCKPYSGGKPDKVVVDGPGGVDNSYGRNIMPLVLTFAKTAPQDANDNIANGEFTVVTRFAAFGAEADQTGLSTQFFAARGPKDDQGKRIAPGDDWSSYLWEPVPEGLVDAKAGAGDDLTSLTAASNGVLAANVWSSGDPTLINLVISLSGISLPLRIRNARVTATFADDHATAAKGILSGVLSVEEMTKAMQLVAGKISPALCEGAIIDNILTQVRQAADMMEDGTQDAAKTCSGISVGLGFESRATKIGKPAPVEPIEPSCP